jgi:ubiquinone/menaquinone biosynthesis C-methylase UbiE
VPGSDHVESARAVYDVAASRYVEFVGTQINPATEAAIDRSLLAAFVELFQGGPAGAVADVGCGPGRVAGFLVEHGLDVIGFDVSEGMLAAARSAHPHIRFEEGELAGLPLDAGVLAGAVCWYSIIYTPPNRLGEAFNELMRVLIPGGYVLLGFQAGNAEPIYRTEAHGTHLPLTSYLHSVEEVAARLEEARFTIYAKVERAPVLEHETTAQGFVFARLAT